MDWQAIPWTLVAVGAACAVVGMLLGFLVGKSRGVNAKRVRELEEELEKTREELKAYQGRVGEHFTRTSDLLRRLTIQYRAVYEHLAEGANVLCPEGSPALQASLAEAALPSAAAAPGAAAGVAAPGAPAAPTGAGEEEEDVRAAAFEAAAETGNLEPDLGPDLEAEPSPLSEVEKPDTPPRVG